MHTDYTYKTSARAKHLRITIKGSQEVIITVPKRIGIAQAERFVQQKEGWITAQLAKLQTKQHTNKLSHLTSADYAKHKETARKLITERVEYFAEKLSYSYGKIAIRNQSTRWGSCSSKGNLNFNYKLALLPAELCDYVVVHELCHLKQMNHSQAFWDLVAQEIPDYKVRRRELKAEYVC